MSETLKALISFGVAIVLIGNAIRAFKSQSVQTLFGEYDRRSRPGSFWLWVLASIIIGLAEADVGLTHVVGTN